MNIVCNMLIENTSVKTLQHGTINVLSRILFVFIVFVINAEFVLSFRNISKYVLVVFLGVTILFRVWELVHFAILFLFIHLAFLLPSVLTNLPAVPFLIPFVLSTVIVILYSPTRSTLSWFKKGHLDSVSIFFALHHRGYDNSSVSDLGFMDR